MPISVSEFIGVDWNTFAQTGAMNAIVDVDSRLFIDPQLLKTTEAPELKNSYSKLTKRFSGICKLLVLSKRPDDPFWRQAWNLLPSREVKGLCIGYSREGTSGSGIGPRFKLFLLDIAKQIVDAGIQDPEIFELMGLFQEGIGPDRISDLVAQIVLEDLLEYSERIFRELGAQARELPIRGRVYKLPINPFNRNPIILVPMDILRDLPVAYDWSDIDIVAQHNEQLRRRVNAIIGSTWKEATRTEKKSILRRTLIAEPELLTDLLECYRGKSASRYDFDDDPAGQLVWYRASRDYAQEYPLELVLPPRPSPDDILQVVLRICQKFRELVEDNGLYELLYEKRGGRPKKEEAAQLLFYGIADAYCAANNLDLSREANAGRGPVDFKISGGHRGRVLVETKLTTNTRLVHGFKTQLPEYQKAERTRHSVYLIIDVDIRGLSWIKRKRELNELILEQRALNHRVPEVMVVNAIPKLSASKYKGP